MLTTLVHRDGYDMLLLALAWMHIGAYLHAARRLKGRLVLGGLQQVVLSRKFRSAAFGSPQTTFGSALLMLMECMRFLILLSHNVVQ